jgi:2-oxoglutarate ferredoxin oxidoreductase subunit delta
MEDAKKAKDTPEIDIYKAWCKGCGICAAFCPTGALARDEAGYPYVKDADKCVECAWCEMRCPDFAIRVSGAKKRGQKARGDGEEEGKGGETAPGQ